MLHRARRQKGCNSLPTSCHSSVFGGSQCERHFERSNAGRVRPSCVRESEAIIPDDTSVARCSADEYAEAAAGPTVVDL